MLFVGFGHVVEFVLGPSLEIIFDEHLFVIAEKHPAHAHVLEDGLPHDFQNQFVVVAPVNEIA